MDAAALAMAQRSIRLATAGRQQFGLLPAPVCAGRVFRPGSFSAVTASTFQRVYRLYTDATHVRFVFQNWAPSGSPEENSPGTITLKAGVIWDYNGGSGGLNVPIYFNGVRTVTLNAYQTIISDPVDVSFTTVAGSYFVVRSYITQSGTNLPVDANSLTAPNGWNEGYMATDLSDSAGNSFGGATFTANFGPIAVCGWGSDGRSRSIYCSGDSIVAGTGMDSAVGASGFLAYALDQAQLGAVSGARSGETVQTITSYSQVAYRMGLVHGCKYAVDNYGTNDVGTPRTTAQIKADLLSYWGYLKRRGLTVYRTTLIPRTTSTDSWQTTGNQTSYGGSGQETVRQQVNQWLRAPASAGAGNSALYDANGALAGIFDVALAVEVNSDGSAITINAGTGAISNGAGGFWKVDATSYDSGTVTSIPNSQKLSDSTKTWTVGQWIGYAVVIVTDTTTPAAVGQLRLISNNTSNTLTSNTAWTTTPSTAATYKIIKTYSMDGIHPTTLGHYLMAAKVDTTKLA